jgi:RNA polymerase sigma-70 factor (ECF subfamily)
VTDWDRLVREQGPMVFGTAWRILGCTADAEDVCQDVFLQAHQLQRTRPVRSWGALLRRLAACRALDRLRRRRRDVPLDGLTLPAADDAPDAALMGRELADRLREAVAMLPPREAAVFCLRCFEDLSYQQIAEALTVSPGAAAAALHKARAKLEALLRAPAERNGRGHEPDARTTARP